MKSRFIGSLAAASALLALPGVAVAQQPPMPNKWDVSSRTITIDEKLPYICDNPFIAARDTINQLDPNFQISSRWAPYSSGSHSMLSYQPKGYGGTVPLATTLKSYTSPAYFWESKGTLVDADIDVNADLIYWPATTDQVRAYDLHCDSTAQGAFTQWSADYQSALLHELGHFSGMEHRTDTTTGPCVMHEQAPRGSFRRIFCSDEKTTFQSTY
jgi:hypothetical protein